MSTDKIIENQYFSILEYPRGIEVSNEILLLPESFNQLRHIVAIVTLIIKNMFGNSDSLR